MPTVAAAASDRASEAKVVVAPTRAGRPSFEERRGSRSRRSHQKQEAGGLLPSERKSLGAPVQSKSSSKLVGARCLLRC